MSGLQLAKLLPSDGAASDQFGTSVAISGATGIIGAPLDDDFGSASGSAYLFDASTGLQIAKLLPDDGAAIAFFGYDVAIDGAVAIVGAPLDDAQGAESGSAYLFDLSSGLQIAKLLPTDGAAGDQFGRTVSIRGTTAIVGAYADSDNGSNSGSAYIFDVTTGLQTAKLKPNDGAAGDHFSSSVAINGTTAIVGSMKNSGSVYLFDASSGLQTAKLLATDGSSGDQFGISAAISGATAIVGAFYDDDNGNLSGSAYLFKALPDLGTDTLTISLNTGGQQVFALEGGPTRANWIYFMFGSVTGTTPGIDFGGGVLLPLNFDVYFNLTLNKKGLGAFGNFIGTLDANGSASASLTLPALMDPSLVGVKLYHAYLAGSVLGIPEFASNAVSVELVL
jgi:hypothetical protein